MVEPGEVAFYGAAVLIVVDVGAFILQRPSGREALAFFLVLIICGFAMFRVWRDSAPTALTWGKPCFPTNTLLQGSSERQRGRQSRPL